MITAFLYFKALHHLALILWLGATPIQLLLLRIAASSVDAKRRKTAVTFVASLTKTQVRIGVAMLIVAGAGMLWSSPIDYLSQGWMHAKLAAVALLLVVDLVLVQKSVLGLSGEAEAGAKPVALAQSLRRVVAVKLPVLFGTLAIAAWTIAHGRLVLFGILSILGVALAAGILGLYRVVEGRVAEALPDV